MKHQTFFYWYRILRVHYSWSILRSIRFAAWAGQLGVLRFLVLPVKKELSH